MDFRGTAWYNEAICKAKSLRVGDMAKDILFDNQPYRRIVRIEINKNEPNMSRIWLEGCKSFQYLTMVKPK